MVSEKIGDILCHFENDQKKKKSFKHKKKNPVNFGALLMVFWSVGILFVQKCSLKACNFCVLD